MSQAVDKRLSVDGQRHEDWSRLRTGVHPETVRNYSQAAPIGGDLSGTIANAIIRAGVVSDDKIGMRVLDEGATVPAGLTASVTGWLQILASRLRGVTGETSVLTAPDITLAATYTHTQAIAGAALGHVKTGGDIGIDGVGAMWINNGAIMLGHLAFTPELASNKNVPGGYAGLDGSGLINSTQLPPLAITATSVVSSQAAMLALTAQTGDVAVRTDQQKTYILKGSDPAALTDWEQLLFPAGVVSITAGSGLSGGTITSTGTIAVNYDNTFISVDGSSKLTVKDGSITGGSAGSGVKLAQSTIIPANVSKAGGTDGMSLMCSSTWAGSAIWGYAEAGSLHYPLPAQTLNSASAALTLTVSGTGGGFAITTSSSGHALRGIASSTGNGVRAESSSSGDALYATNTSTGRAVYAQVTAAGGGNAVRAESASTADCVYMLNTSTTTGRAATIEINSGTNSSDAALIKTAGTGNALVVDYRGGGTSTTTARNIAIFQATGVNKARIDNTGKGYFNGGTQTGGADFAEAVEFTGSKEDYELGDVLVIDTANDHTFTRSTSADSFLVAGVVVSQDAANMLAGVPEDGMDGAKPRIAMARNGIVSIKVNDEGGAIARGDCLASSSHVGEAKRVDPFTAHPLAIIGRALEAFTGSTGSGIITALINPT
ncbi:MAG TPA: hypothetical protein VHI13_16855 [Candidatus Kapabacteria bacterium]|nr:hypothetical protein [Candidatus Kapabacteria bacterium]